MNNKKFSIPKIEGKDKKKKRSRFISPYFGQEVEDNLIVPKSMIGGNINERYQDFDDDKKKKISKEQLMREFNVFDSTQARKFVENSTPNRKKQEVSENQNESNFIKINEKKKNVTFDAFFGESQIIEDDSYTIANNNTFHSNFSDKPVNSVKYEEKTKKKNNDDEREERERIKQDNILKKQEERDTVERENKLQRKNEEKIVEEEQEKKEEFNIDNYFLDNDFTSGFVKVDKDENTQYNKKTIQESDFNFNRDCDYDSEIIEEKIEVNPEDELPLYGKRIEKKGRKFQSFMENESEKAPAIDDFYQTEIEEINILTGSNKIKNNYNAENEATKDNDFESFVFNDDLENQEENKEYEITYKTEDEEDQEDDFKIYSVDKDKKNFKQFDVEKDQDYENHPFEDEHYKNEVETDEDEEDEENQIKENQFLKETDNIKSENKQHYGLDDDFEDEEEIEKTETYQNLKKEHKKNLKFVKPSLDLLNTVVEDNNEDNEYLYEQEEIINDCLRQFKVAGEVNTFTNGPTITQYEVKLQSGVMVNKITNIQNNLKMNLAAVNIRIEAPIPGKRTIGIEVPNKVRKLVNLGNIIDKAFVNKTKPLEVALGVNLAGETVLMNLQKMPHGLIAGATGSGKSVCIDTILMSLLYKMSPDDLKLILIDPKRVGLAAYSKIPHLATPIIHDAEISSESLKWAVEEMEKRYDLMFSVSARDIDSYNKKVEGREKEGFRKLPFIVIIIEEMADLMAQVAADVELSVSRIAQKARAAGIILLIATQRPSVDVIKGTIKSNIPTRIALKVSSNTDSMTIIDFAGAETLLGNGDMLYQFNGTPIQRVQGAYVSDEEIDALTGYLSQFKRDYIFSKEKLEKKVKKQGILTDLDLLFTEVAEYVITTNYASINKIQVNFNIGYNRAKALFDQLLESGIVGKSNSKTPRKVLVSIEEFRNKFS